MTKTLDTNVCSFILRQHPQSALQVFADLARDQLFISAIVAAELRFGAVKKGSERLTHQIEDFLTGFSVAPWPESAGHRYAQIRAELERQGRPIGNMDLLIAAHALAADAVLVTHNIREFERVPGLRVENWG